MVNANKTLESPAVYLASIDEKLGELIKYVMTMSSTVVTYSEPVHTVIDVEPEPEPEVKPDVKPEPVKAKPVFKKRSNRNAKKHK